MSDIQLDLDVLRSARSRVGDALATFESAGTVGGDVAVRSTVSAIGEGAVAVATDDNVGGKLVIGGAVSTTGFRYTTRPADAAVEKLDADDLLIGGPALSIEGNVTGGIVVAVPPISGVRYFPSESTDSIASIIFFPQSSRPK